MNRYYYTDPLAAAWQAKHHGMVFDEPLVERLGYGETLTGLMQHATGEKVIAWPKFYIHPDSLHLLEPKVGDTLAEEGSTLRLVWDGWTKGGKPIAETGLLPLNNPRIIQRNGIPYHWPESEA